MSRIITILYKTNPYLHFRKSYANRGIKNYYTMMHGKGRYKFKVINGVLSWKNNEMERFMPVSAEILTRVILLYEKELKNGINIWKQIEESEDQSTQNSLHFIELATWMEQLQSIFANMEPYREKERWIDDQIHLN